ncbi:MAG TPA: type II toxin-antitoxin system VapC family toxin [Gemmataceae bacterium]|nr:type II toxin-antitoxin system VapC family toxin [Gemmataceae bacterium]
MKYVIDSSVAFKWVVAEQHDAKARQLRDEFRRTVHDLLAPDVFPAELAHALTRAERPGRITIGQALALWADVMTTPPRLLPAVSLVPRAITISSPMRIGVYDCLYVALAEQEQCEFLTADDRLVRALQPQFPFIVPLASLP